MAWWPVSRWCAPNGSVTRRCTRWSCSSATGAATSRSSARSRSSRRSGWRRRSAPSTCACWSSTRRATTSRRPHCRASARARRRSDRSCSAVVTGSTPASISPSDRAGSTWGCTTSARGRSSPASNRACAAVDACGRAVAPNTDNHVMQAGRSVFPFTAIVGQEQMRQALVLNAINPAIGGVLIRGEKGTAKSTAVRALARLLPEQEVVVGCHFGCDPDPAEQQCADCSTRSAAGEELPREPRQMRVVELPINASEDRVVGSIDIEAAIKTGEKRFEPGVLAEANRNILYVDEVNLLDDHIVDVLLDAAAMGLNTVEREGVSVAHLARFILVGTMNPEEGDLRPQLLDRFGLCVDVAGIRDVAQRVEIVERREDFEEDPEAFAARYDAQETAEAARIARAIRSLPDVEVDRDILVGIAALGIELEVDGHRADIVTRKSAQALAAYENRDRATFADVERVAPAVLAHRVKPAVAGTKRNIDLAEVMRRAVGRDED